MILTHLVIVFGVIGFLIYLFMPIREKKNRYIFFTILLILIIGISVVPGDFFCNVTIPYINKTGNTIIEEFIQKNVHLRSLVEFSPEIQTNVVFVVQGYIRGVIACLVFGIFLLFSNIVCYFKQLFSGRSFILYTFSFILILAMTVVVIASPICSINSLYTTLNDTTAKKNEKFYETYSGFDEYNEIFELLNEIHDFIEPITVSKYITIVGDAFSLGYADMLKTELTNVDPYLQQLKESGLTIIFTNDSFCFRDTTKSTFDFNKINDLVHKVSKSKIYADIVRTFGNQILSYAETKVKQDSGNTKVVLQLNKDDFNSQVYDIINLLKIVVDYNLINYVQQIENFDFDNFLSSVVPGVKDLIIQVLNDNGFQGAIKILDILATIDKYPIVRKIQYYMNFSSPQEAAIYTCLSLYEILDTWLENYRTTTFYSTSKTFLTNRSII